MISTRDLGFIIERLKSQRHRDSTRKQYYQIWKQFASFFQRLDFKPDRWEERITLFVAYLVEMKKQSSTVKTYISAVRSVLKTEGFKLNEDMFLINALTRACKICNDKIKTRLPISRSLLKDILIATRKHFINEKINQPYLAALYQTLFPTAYYGMLRVGRGDIESAHLISQEC